MTRKLLGSMTSGTCVLAFLLLLPINTITSQCKRMMNISYKHFKLFLALAALAALSPAALLAQASGNVSAGEFANFTLVFDLPIPNNLDTGSTGTPPYTTDNSGSITAGSFDRIAYYLELNTGSGAQFIWVSMDAFTTDPTKTGVPTVASGAFFQQLVSNMNIESNVVSIVTGTGITTGNIEFWPSTYATGTTIGGLGASEALYDWDDSGANSTAGYGSMQVHNHGATSQVLFGYNRWAIGGGNDDLGIGNNPTVHPDWTDTQNASTYTTTKILQVYVKSSVVLPVELVYFRAQPKNEVVLLSWQTATELNNEGFEIQRAAGNAALEAGRWQVLAFVAGNGSTNEIQNYSYSDERPQAGINYYRLKQIDFDGKFEYSDVVSVQFAVSSPQLEVFPNPVRAAELTLYIPETNGDKAIIRLYDQTGRLALQQTTASQQQTLNVSQLAAGIYFVEVTVGGKVFREKVVVE